MLAKLAEILARLGVFRLLIALKAISSIFTGFIASRIRAHSKSVGTPAKYGADHYVQVGPYTVHYVEIGSGDPLVLLPGAYSTYRAWNRVIPLLSGFRIIAIDHLGSGSSDKPKEGFNYSIAEQVEVIAELINHLAIGPVCIAGAVYGASIALELAHKYPLLVGRLVLLENDAESDLGLPQWYETLLKYPIVGDFAIAVLKSNLFNRLIVKLMSGAYYASFTLEDKRELLEELFYNTSGASRIAWYKLSRAEREHRYDYSPVDLPIKYIGGNHPHYSHLFAPHDVAKHIDEFCHSP